MLQITNLHATATGKPIRDGLSLTINAGEVPSRIAIARSVG